MTNCPECGAVLIVIDGTLECSLDNTHYTDIAFPEDEARLSTMTANFQQIGYKLNPVTGRWES